MTRARRGQRRSIWVYSLPVQDELAHFVGTSADTSATRMSGSLTITAFFRFPILHLRWLVAGSRPAPEKQPHQDA